MSESKYVLSIDPGVSTGIALIGYEPEKAPWLEGAWQFTGGVQALKHWLRTHWRAGGWDDYNDEPAYPRIYLEKPYRVFYTDRRWDYSSLEGDKYFDADAVVITEKFTARNTKGFSYTTASLEPLRGEGALIMCDIMPDYTPKEKRWRDPGLQYLVGGEDLADKKKRQHAFLKDAGFYRTNKDFPDSPAKDQADDFRSAAAHGLAYLARELKHKPTFDLMTEWSAA